MTTTFTQDEQDNDQYGLRLDIERAEHELLMSFYELRRLLRLLPRGARGRAAISELSRSILAIEGNYAVVCPLCGNRMARKERYFHRDCADAEQAWADMEWSREHAPLTAPSGLVLR